MFNLKGSSSLKVVKLRGTHLQECKDDVAVERAISLYVNKKPIIVLMATPLYLEALAVGHLLSEGILKSLEEVEGLKVDKFEVYFAVKPCVEKRLNNYSSCKVKFSSSIESLKDLEPNSFKIPKVTSKVKFTVKHVFEAVEKLNEGAKLFKRTGCVHAALLMDEGFNVLCLAEDVGRHNALDKALGMAVFRKAELDRLLLAITGRLSMEMVIKALRFGIPAIVSISAPTKMGVNLAQKAGLTLVGFVRGDRFNVYSKSETLDLQVSSQLSRS